MQLPSKYQACNYSQTFEVIMQARQKFILVGTGLLFFTVIAFTSIQNQKRLGAHVRVLPHHYKFYSTDVVQIFPQGPEAQLYQQRELLNEYKRELQKSAALHQPGPDQSN